MTKYKTASAMGILLALTFAISIVALPVNAQLNVPYVSTGKCETYAFIGTTPNPVGIGQDVLLHVGITQQLSLVQYGWEGLTVTVTKPDGTTSTLGPFRTDSTGGTGAVFKPDVVGNYTFQTHFPEQRMPASVSSGGFSGLGVPVNTTMLASDSDKVTLVVQQESIQYYPSVPLPTGYWTRPINAQLREWYTISGSSWMSNEYNEAPDSPHVLWTKPLTTGGLVGGMMGELGSGATSVAWENGDAYEGKWGQLLFGGGNAFVLAGRLYYQTGSYDRPRLIFCVDLRTGEELWSRTFLNNQSLTFGQLFYWESYNYQGTFGYLWITSGTTWYAFDPFTGEWRASITNVPSGTRVEGPRGEIYIYSVNLQRGWMALWNMSAFVSMAGSWGSAFSNREFNATSGASRSLQNDGSLGSWSSSGGAARVARAWAWNITIPTGLTGSIRAINWTDGRVVGSNVAIKDVNTWAFAIPPLGKESPAPNPTPAGAPGTLLYNTHWTPPTAWANQTITWATTDVTDNIGVIWSKEARQNFAFDLKTGTYLWTTQPELYLNVYGSNKRVYNGKLYSTGYSGRVYCYDLATGEAIWTYDAADPYQAEVLWSSNWPESIYFTQGGKLYLFHMEHSANQPLPRGAPAICLNATNGDVIWRVNGLFRTTNWGGQPILADSVIAMYNTYDQQVYAMGKGPSAITASAPDIGVPFGTSVTVKGFVTDVSPGTQDEAVKMRFPNGVPVVSDESQGEWMKHVYAQFPHGDVTGVPVYFHVVDANGNYRNIGQTTTDPSGFYSIAWEPDIAGKYNVIVSFAGSNSYYPSYAYSAFFVEEPVPVVTPPETPADQPSIADTYFIAGVAVIVVAIAIVGALIMLMLRKRP